MKEFVKTSIELMKLAYQWVTKILLAKSHFKVAPWTKLWLNLQGYLVDQYMIYDFKHRDRKQYLSEFDWYRSRRINGDYSFILNNKMVCADMLKQYTSVPETYASKIRKAIMLADGSIASDEDILECLRQKKAAIMKPINFGKGKDVHLIGYENGSFFMDLQPIGDADLVAFLRKSKDWFLSEFVRQADHLNDIYAETANTIRMIAFREPATEKFKIFFAVQRIGTARTVPVDNGSRGGLVANIDLATGTLSEARSLHALDVHEVHPDSGKPIKGVKLPHFDKLQQDILDLSNRFPYLSFIAWDILVTNEGFSIIEANTSSGVNIIQLWGGQRQGELGDFYRAHGIKV